MATARRTTAQRTSAAKTAPAFTDEEKSAMKERAKEVKAAKSGNVDDATAVLDKIAEMEDSDRALAEKVHQVITDAAPGLAPRLWYAETRWTSGPGFSTGPGLDGLPHREAPGSARVLPGM